MAKKMSLSLLAASVKQDIQAFLSGLTRPFTCEADFQHSLAEYLRGTGKYQNVYLEYFVPNVVIASKTSNAYIDIVVENNCEFVPIERKFKTTSLKSPATPYSCFGFPTNSPIYTHMAAHNDNRYAVWKDVKRIEWIKSHPQYSKTVKNGFVVFISNDPAYQRPAKGYSTANCSHSKPVEYHSRKPELEISDYYDIDWQPIPGITIGGTQPCGADPQPCVNGEKANPGFSYIIIEV